MFCEDCIRYWVNAYKSWIDRTIYSQLSSFNLLGLTKNRLLFFYTITHTRLEFNRWTSFYIIPRKSKQSGREYFTNTNVFKLLTRRCLHIWQNSERRMLHWDHSNRYIHIDNKEVSLKNNNYSIHNSNDAPSISYWCFRKVYPYDNSLKRDKIYTHFAVFEKSINKKTICM